MSITGNEYQKNLFKTGIKAGPVSKQGRQEKDALLEDATITMPEMAQLLGTTRSAVYTILDNPKYSHF
ncbi:MAG: hypothetical protein ACLVHS_13785 [Blautia wexlerae]